MISWLENYVDLKFDEAEIKYLNKKYFVRFSDVAKAKGCSQLLIDGLKDQINSFQNELKFLLDELKVKNHLLELIITSKKQTLIPLILPASKSATIQKKIVKKNGATQSILIVIIISR